MNCLLTLSTIFHFFHNFAFELTPPATATVVPVDMLEVEDADFLPLIIAIKEFFLQNMSTIALSCRIFLMD